MADQELPADYDAIILGTGMTECIIAAALSRIGWKVLHLDRYDYYSADWATFNFEGLQNWIQSNKESNDEGKLKAKEANLAHLLKEGERSLPLCVNSTNISNVKDFLYVSDEEPEQVEEKVESGQGENTEEKENATNEEKSQGQSQEKSETQEGENKPEETDASEKVVKEKEEKKPCEERPDNVKTVKKWTYKEIKTSWRKFNLDLAPRVLYCRGPMVELLISSDIAKYCTFRNITRVLTQLNGKLESVPCSRSDVFSSKQVSMIEKRMLMKFLTFAIDFEKHPEEYAAFTDKPFTKFLKSKKLSANVHHYVHNAIAMATEQTNTLEGLKSTQKFLQSLGRHGNTAFLWPLYGSGELPQCFCRMCAVFGGIYCLRRSGTQLLIDAENKCSGIVDTEGQRLNAKYVVMEASFASKEILPSATESHNFISRAIFLTDRSILTSDKDHISLLCIPPVHENGSYVTIYELSHLSCACPKDIFVVQMSCKGIKNAEEDLRPVMESLFSIPNSGDGAVLEDKPQVLWSLFYEQKDTSSLSLPENSPEGIFVVPSTDLALDFDEPIRIAREIFDKLCPGEEFLPKAPNPEDIVFENDGEKTEESGFEGGASDASAAEGETAPAEGEKSPSKEMKSDDKEQNDEKTEKKSEEKDNEVTEEDNIKTKNPEENKTDSASEKNPEQTTENEERKDQPTNQDSNES